MSSPQSPREPTMEEILASIRRIIAEEGQGAPAKQPGQPAPAVGKAAGEPVPAKIVPPGPAPSKAPAKEDVLELTELVEEGAPLLPAAVPPPAAVGDPLPPPLPETPAPAPEPARPPQPAPLAALPAPAVEGEGPLLTLEVEERVTASLREAAEAVRPEHSASAGVSPLETLVLEALRPSLKSWIEQNLPDLVERVVREEVRRLARRVEDE